MTRRRHTKPVPPAPSGDDSLVIDLGEPVYAKPVPEARGVVPIVSGDRTELHDLGEPTPPRPKLDPDRPLIPTAGEIAVLPGAARVAFLDRCRDRLRPWGGPADTTPDDMAGVVSSVFRAATTRTPVTHILRLIRRDFDRLARLAKENNWADDTPVPPDVLGPLWPGKWRPDQAGWNAADQRAS
jgi:hypothetical protein